MLFSDGFWQQRDQIRNFHRVFPLEVFLQMVRDANPQFYDNEYNIDYFPINYVRWLLFVKSFGTFCGDVVCREPRFFSFYEIRARIETFLLAYFNLWSAEEEITLQRAFYQYEQLVRLDVKETCLTAIDNMLRCDFPRNLSFMQMHEIKHLPSSKLWKSFKGNSEKVPYYFLHPDLTFTWVPTVHDFNNYAPLHLFLTENKLFHYKPDLSDKTYIPFVNFNTEREYSYWMDGYKYTYVLEGTTQNKKLIDTAIAEHVDRVVSVMKPSFESFIRELISRFFSDDNLIGNSNRELNHVKDEPLFQFAADPAWKPQRDKLSKFEVALGNDFNYFYTDPLVQKHLYQLLNNPNLTPFLIKTAIKKWLKFGYPATGSPFAELIENLIG